MSNFVSDFINRGKHWTIHMDIYDLTDGSEFDDEDGSIFDSDTDLCEYGVDEDMDEIDDSFESVESFLSDNDTMDVHIGKEFGLWPDPDAETYDDED